MLLLEDVTSADFWQSPKESICTAAADAADGLPALGYGRYGSEVFALTAKLGKVRLNDNVRELVLQYRSASGVRTAVAVQSSYQQQGETVFRVNQRAQ